MLQAGSLYAVLLKSFFDGKSLNGLFSAKNYLK